jgi:hypothetical protein
VTALPPALARLWLRSLDSFTRCGCPGCDWHVQTPDGADPRCTDHGGGPWPQYLPDDDGAFLAVRHIAAESDDEEA